MKTKIKKFLTYSIDAIFLMGSSSSTPDNSGWKFRRKLIFGAYRLAFAMVVFGGVTFIWDTEVSRQLIIGGVALMSIIIGAYVAGSSYEDAKVKQDRIEP